MSGRDTVAFAMLAELELLSAQVIFVCWTAHVLSAADWRRRQPLTATRLMSSAKCAGARPDNDWCSGTPLSLYSSTDRKLVKLVQQMRDMVMSS